MAKLVDAIKAQKTFFEKRLNYSKKAKTMTFTRAEIVQLHSLLSYLEARAMASPAAQETEVPDHHVS